jgi:hypothetical protein
MRFECLWHEDETTYQKVTFTLEELQAAAAETGLDVQAFRGMYVFEDHTTGHHLDTDGRDPKAIAYMEPRVAAALNRRQEVWDRQSAWSKAKRFGWQVLDAEGKPVPEPESPGADW